MRRLIVLAMLAVAGFAGGSVQAVGAPNMLCGNCGDGGPNPPPFACAAWNNDALAASDGWEWICYYPLGWFQVQRL